MRVMDRIVTYCDTDSLIYIRKPGEAPKVKTGDYLGDVTNELEEFGQGSYITEFVSGVPKNYAFSVLCLWTETHKTRCKEKSITLNYNTSKVVNFDSLRKMVKEDPTSVDVHNPKKFKRKHGGRVISAPESKGIKGRL
jgi:hypothetical protein